jgi:predicted transcriptional regulator
MKGGSNRLVRDVMQQRFVVMDGLATVQEGINAMIERGVEALFIQRRSPDDEHGIVVLADIAEKVLAGDRAPDRVNLYEIMTKPVIWVDPQMKLRYCARLFGRFGLQTAPVIEDREIIGVVTYREIVLRGLLQHA